MTLPSKEKQKAVATGTDNKPIGAVQHSAKELKPTAFSACNQPATIGNEQDNSQEKASSPNCLENEKLDNKNDSFSANVTGKKAIRLGGRLSNCCIRPSYSP